MPTKKAPKSTPAKVSTPTNSINLQTTRTVALVISGIISLVLLYLYGNAYQLETEQQRYLGNLYDLITRVGLLFAAFGLWLLTKDYKVVVSLIAAVLGTVVVVSIMSIFVGLGQNSLSTGTIVYQLINIAAPALVANYLWKATEPKKK